MNKEQRLEECKKCEHYWSRLERVTNGATENTDDIFLLTVDCHYQASRFATPNKAPDFYA